MAYYNSYLASDGNAARLATPVLDFTGQTAPTLKFWLYHYDTASNYTDRIQVQISTDGGTSYSNLGAAMFSDDNAGTGWRQHVVDLSAYIGVSNIRVALLGISNYGYRMNVDDVTVGSPAPSFSASAKTVSPSGMRFTGEVLTYTIGIVNSGDLTSTATALSDPIPAGTTYIPGSAQLTGTGTLTATARLDRLDRRSGLERTRDRDLPGDADCAERQCDQYGHHQ